MTTAANRNVKDDPSNPYLTVVATARNDNHGGDLLGRAQLFLDQLADQAHRHQLHTELILVEWNPPADRPSLADALDWPQRPDADNAPRYFHPRVVRVPHAIHRRYEHSDRLPLFQMIAKNVGIRRARAPFILATNVDILLSEPLFRFIATRRLRPNKLYRCDRHDVAPHPARSLKPDQRLDWCAQHVVRLNTRVGSTRVHDGHFHRIYWDRSPRVALLETLQDLRLVPVVTRKRLHCNACGDFTLMHRDAWHRVRAYAETPMYSMHLDSILCTAAHFAGYREHTLAPPMLAYHLEHDTGSGWSPEGQAALDARLSKSGIPQMSVDQYHKWSVQMRRDRAPMLFNDERWGLADDQLDESAPTHAAVKDAA